MDLTGGSSIDQVSSAAPIRVSDAAAMFRRKIGPNTRPYDNAVIKNNNKMIDDWEERVLKRIANKGVVKSSDVWSSWMIYYEGYVISKLIPLMEAGLITGESEETLEFCKTLLKKPIEELCTYGNAIVLRCWQILQHELKMIIAEQKYNLVFSQSDDPVEWYRMSKEHQDLFAGRIFPFWSQDEFDDVSQKIAPIVNFAVKPN